MASPHPPEGSSALKPAGKFSLKDREQWPEGERWELIDGEAWNMSPAPNREHQKFVGSLYAALHNYLESKTCEAYVAPIDVFLSEEGADEDATVVQPDVLVVCDPRKLAPEGIRGAPDFIAEVLSPATAAKDLEEKKALYERRGVREYWIVRSDGSVFAWVHDGRRYLPATEYLGDMEAPSAVLPGFVWAPRR